MERKIKKPCMRMPGKIKRAVSIGLAAFLLFIPPMAVSAEDRQGQAGWQVSFNGRGMDSNFSTANIGDEINAMQPGDSVELTITLKNDFDGQADWYMKNKVLETLEDAGNAAGGAYDYLLTYTDTAGETTTLYSSQKFGGDGKINGVGLHGATKTLENYFYLDRMGKDATGVVKLKVALDGETLVNNYQNTYARLQMDFATELVDTGTRTTPGGFGGRSVVRTGDETEIMRYVVLMLGSGLLLLVFAVLRFHKEQEGEAAISPAAAEASGQDAAEKTGKRRR